jgi:thiamine biosynthesis lipoprotein
MGTYAMVQIEGGTNQDVEAAFNKIKELDNLLSDYNPGSEISEINSMAGEKAVKVDPQVVKVLDLAKEVASETDGIFDPTIGALTIGVYRFGREEGEAINIREVDRAKTLINFRDLIINGYYVYLKKKGMMIDLGGIGKGYAVEEAANVLKERGVNSGIVSLSGDIKVFGNSVDISIQNPYGEGTVAKFSTGKEDLAISTSGSYQRFVDLDGKSYHHLIAPETGRPGSDFLSLTVVTDGSSTFADAYATALFIMGKEKTIDFISEHKNIGVFIVFADGEIYYNKTFSSLVNDLRVIDPGLH